MKPIILAALVAALITAAIVEAAGPTLDTCTLSWYPVTTRADGTPFTPAKYGVYLTKTTGVYPATPQMLVPAPATTTDCAAAAKALGGGQMFAVIKALDAANIESAISNEVAFIFSTATGAAPVGLGVAP